MYDRFKLPSNFIIPAEGVYDRYSREIALRYACNSGNEQCLADTFKLIQQLAESDLRVPKGLEDVVYCSGMRGTNKQTEWYAIWNKLLTPTDATFRSQLISALGCSDDQALLKEFLETSIGAGGLANYSQNERRAVLSAVLNSYSGLEAVINFMTEFEIDILRDYGYTSLDILLNVPARTIKNSDQQSTYMSYLISLTHLLPASLKNIVQITVNNIDLQGTPENTVIMDKIKKWKVPDPATEPPTTTITQSSTIEPPTTTITQSSSTEPPTTTQSSTTNVPITSSTTQISTTAAAPLTNGVKIVTLLTSLAVVFYFRF